MVGPWTSLLFVCLFVFSNPRGESNLKPLLRTTGSLHHLVKTGQCDEVDLSANKRAGLLDHGPTVMALKKL